MFERHKISSATALYDGPFAEDYDDLVGWGILPGPRPLFELCRPFLQASQPKNLLDVGIGSGLSAQPFSKEWPGITVHGIDGSRRMLDLCRQALPDAILTCQDVEQGSLPDEDNLFDVSISSGTLYMLPDPLPLLRDMMRVTRSRGLVCFNLEASPDNNVHERHNDATTNPADRKWVITYQHSLAAIGAAITQSGGEILASQQRLPMKKLEGPPVCFTDMLVRKL